MFNNLVDETDEEAQSEFKAEVGHYVNGRLWRSFTDPLSCNQAVGEALAQVTALQGPLRKAHPSKPVLVPWISDVTADDQPGPLIGAWTGGNRVGLVPGSVYAPIIGVTRGA